MARLREFDVDEAVEQAMNVFWEYGYAETGIQDLLSGMGLSRGSFYKAFVSKKDLFLKVLDLYDETHVKPAVALLSGNDGHGRERIKTLFDTVFEYIETGDRRGCLLCNTAVGACHVDADIQRQVLRMIDDLTMAFQSTLIDGAGPDYLQETAEAEARNLVLTYVGVRSLTRSGRDVDWLRMGAMPSAKISEV